MANVSRTPWMGTLTLTTSNTAYQLMKTTLLLLLASISCFAQGGNTVIVNFPGAPSGTCAPIMVAVNNATGEYFDCLSGSWNSVGGTGGGITINTTAITGGGANRVLFESATNKVSESANFTWDNTNGALEVKNFIVTATNGGGDANNSVFSVNPNGNNLASVSTATAPDGPFVYIGATNGGTTTITTPGTAGNGGYIEMYSGPGGSISTALTSGTARNPNAELKAHVAALKAENDGLKQRLTLTDARCKALAEFYQTDAALRQLDQQKEKGK